MLDPVAVELNGRRHGGRQGMLVDDHELVWAAVGRTVLVVLIAELTLLVAMWMTRRRQTGRAEVPHRSTGAS